MLNKELNSLYKPLKVMVKKKLFKNILRFTIKLIEVYLSPANRTFFKKDLKPNNKYFIKRII
jgi:hypothetical protein